VVDQEDPSNVAPVQALLLLAIPIRIGAVCLFPVVPVIAAILIVVGLAAVADGVGRTVVTLTDARKRAEGVGVPIGRPVNPAGPGRALVGAGRVVVRVGPKFPLDGVKLPVARGKFLPRLLLELVGELLIGLLLVPLPILVGILPIVGGAVALIVGAVALIVIPAVLTIVGAVAVALIVIPAVLTVVGILALVVLLPTPTGDLGGELKITARDRLVQGVQDLEAILILLIIRGVVSGLGTRVRLLCGRGHGQDEGQ
jgi:hypothetical protein